MGAWDHVLAYAGTMSLFGGSAPAVVFLVFANWAITAIHVYEEWKGATVPLWRVFGAVIGVWIPHWLGLLLFAGGLLLVLWGVGLAGLSGWLFQPLDQSVAVIALGAIIGARIADSLILHWALYAVGYRPNPGIKSTALYMLEAAILMIVFREGLASGPSALGFVLGVIPFVLVWLTLGALRLIPAWRRPQWTRGQPIPDWTVS